MNEIALANFYRVLNDADRFPTERELAEAAIAAKDELNSLRAHPQPLGSAEAAQNPSLYIIKRRGRILPNHYLHAENAAESLGKWGGELIALYDAFTYKCPFCNTSASGPTALRDHLLACEDFAIIHKRMEKDRE